MIHFGCEDGGAILILGCSDEVVGEGDLENASAVRATATKASGAPEAVVEDRMVSFSMAAFKGGDDGFDGKTPGAGIFAEGDGYFGWWTIRYGAVVGVEEPVGVSPRHAVHDIGAPLGV